MIKAGVSFSFIFLFFALQNGPVSAADKSSSAAKKSVQQVGGLLFDVDEGVKIEQGSGGSVYLKSNRDFMQNKFAAIESRFSDLEERVKRLEKQLKPEANASGAKEDVQDSDGRKVLVG